MIAEKSEAVVDWSIKHPSESALTSIYAKV